MIVKSKQVVASCQECGGEFGSKGHAKYCPACRPGRRRAKQTKYRITGPVKALLKDRYNSLVRGRIGELAGQLGWPKFAVQKAAVKLGLTHPWPKDRRAWTPGEVRFLEQWAGRRSPKWIGQHLEVRRGETSVRQKLRRLNISRRITEGYGMRELERCLGADHRVINGWIEQGWLGGERLTPGLPGSQWVIAEADVYRFVREHRDQYELHRVDAEWFLWLLLDSPSATVR